MSVRAFRRVGVASYSKSGGEEWMRLMGPTRDGSRDTRPIGRLARIRFNAQSVPRPHAETPIRFFCEAGTIGATKATLVLALNKAAARDTRQSVTTGLIASSDPVIVSISGVIKKYK